MARRITRKQLKKNDEFVSTMDTLVRKFSDYWKQTVIGLGIFLLAVFLWWIFSQWSSSRQDKASVMLNSAIKVFQTAKTDGTPTEKVRGAFEKVISTYSRTDQSDMARLYLARLDLDAGKVDEARATLVKIKNRHQGDAIGRVAALDLLHLQISSGQGAEVARELEKMVVGRDKTLPRDTALFELGQVYLEEQKNEQAREYFQKIVDDFPDSPYAAKAKEKIQSLG